MKHIEYESNRNPVIKEILKKKVFLLLLVCDSCIKLGDLIHLAGESASGIALTALIYLNIYFQTQI